MFQCNSLVFGGEAPLSEIESLSLHDYMAHYRPSVKMYVSVHSFGDLVIYPWGYEGSPGRIANWEVHHEAGVRWADAIRAVTGKNYQVGNIAEIFYNEFGASDDHMAGEHKVELAFTVEVG